MIYTYNLAGLPETVQRKESTDTSAKNVVTNFDYSPTGQVALTSFANGVTTTNTFDSTKLYRLTHKVTTSGSNNIQDISYVYDPVGNITTLTDNSTTDAKKTVTYGYDSLNRLTSASTTGAPTGQSNYSQTYSYDPVGNILSKSDQGTYTYGGTGSPNPDAVTAIGANTFTYDANGNMLTSSTGAGQTNTWDYNNRLIQTDVGSSFILTDTYSYDQNGQRITLSSGDTTTIYPTKLFNTDGTTPSKHIFANGVDIATVTGTGSSATATFTNTDQLTGPNVVTDGSTAAIAETLDYLPFGSIRFDEQTGANEQRKYAGHEYDQDTNLSYEDARYYNADVGRWVSEDPIFLELGGSEFNKDFAQSFVGTQYQDLDQKVLLNNYLSNPQSLNAYSYTTNNPIRYIDPNGKSTQDVALGLQGFGTSLEAIGLGADATIFGAPAGVVIQGAGAVLIGVGTTISLVKSKDKIVVPQVFNASVADETNLFPNGPPKSPWKKIVAVTTLAATAAGSVIDDINKAVDSTRQEFSKVFANNKNNTNQNNGTKANHSNIIKPSK